MRLVLQTNIAGLISIWVVKRETVVSHIIKKTKWHGADKILVNIETALFKSRNNINDVENIIVVRGPGPFTAVRS